MCHDFFERKESDLCMRRCSGRTGSALKGFVGERVRRVEAAAAHCWPCEGGKVAGPFFFPPSSSEWSKGAGLEAGDLQRSYFQQDVRIH